MPKFVENLESRTFFAVSTFLLEAESAAVSGATVGNDVGGYTGSGYVDFLHAWNDSVEWTVNAPAAGTHKLAFRYANGSSDRPLVLRVNGQVKNSRLSFAPTGSWQTWKTTTVDVALAAGANKVRLTAAGFNGPNLDSLTVTTPDTTEPPPPPPPPSGTYEAESAARFGPTVSSSIPGFTGSGFVDYGSSAGQWVEWTVNEASAGSRSLAFRYANGSSDRPLELRVNGQVVNSRLSMPNTGSWQTWKTVTANATLAAGANKIRLTSLGAGPNVDSLKVSGTVEPPPPPPPPPGGVFEAESANLYGPAVSRSNSGFTGTGYADYARSSGDVIEWVVNSPAAGTRTITFRYANGGGDKPLALRVNGQTVNPALLFPYTGGWRVWKTATASVSLAAGANSIRLVTTGSNGPNVDSLTVPNATQPTTADRLNVAAAFAAEQLRRTAGEVPAGDLISHTLPDGTWNRDDSIDWQSGFLSGAMSQMYRRTGDAFWQNQAAARTVALRPATGRHYDTSFILFKSFKPLYDQTGDPAYRQVLLDAAAAKAGAFHEKAGVFRGWNRGSQSDDPRADVGTYIDLMADLELILWAAKETGNTAWRDMAIRHATESAQHVVRADGSTIQWGYFDDATGDFVLNEQYQGYDVNSTWSRGQAWAIYGFTLAYRETGNPLFLATAKKTADWYLAHLPADKVPFWDFEDPGIPSVPKDSSAAAIAAAGLLDLAKQLPGTADATRYRAAAESTLLSLAGPTYSAQGSTYRSILRRGALNVPRDVGNNVGLISGDYFYLEALNRYFGR